MARELQSPNVAGSDRSTERLPGDREHGIDAVSASPTGHSRDNKSRAIDEAATVASHQISREASAGASTQPATVGQVMEHVTPYAELVGNFRRRSQSSRETEARFVDSRGLLGSLPDYLFFDHPPMPDRWDPLIARWQALEDQLGTFAPAPGADPGATAEAAHRLLEAFQTLAIEDREARDAFLEYLGDHVDHTADTAFGVQVAGDLAILGVVYLTTRGMAPTVERLISTGVARIGLTGTSAAVTNRATTFVALSAMGAYVDAKFRTKVALVNQMIDVLHNANAAGQRALDESERLDFHKIEAEGWVGLRHGLVDGVLLRLVDLANPLILKGAGVLAQRLISKLAQPVLEKALARATAMGGSGVVAALSAGIHALIAGDPWSMVVTKMEAGFAAGAVFHGATKLATESHGL